MSNSGVTGLAAGGGTVSSVFGRSGAVVAAGGDYNATQVAETHTAANYTPTAATVDGHIAGIDTKMGTFGTGSVTSVFGRGGVVVAASGDYSGATVAETRSASHYTAAAATVEGHLAGVDNALGALVTGVSSVFGRSGAVVKGAGDYAGADVTETRTATGYTAAGATVEGHLAGIDTALVGKAPASGAGIVDGTSFHIETVANKTYVLIDSAPRALVINSLEVRDASGTCTLAVQIGGTNVTGLGAVAASSTPGTSNATAANAVAAGGRVTMVASANAAALDLTGTLKYTLA